MAGRSSGTARYMPSSDQSPGAWKSLPAVTIRANSRARIDRVPTCSAGCTPLTTSMACPPAWRIGDQAPALGPGEIIMIRVRQADPGARLAQAADHFLQGRPVLLTSPSLPAPSHLRNASARSLTQPPWTRNSAKCGRAGALPLSPRARWIARAPSSAPAYPGRKPPVDFLGARPAAPVQGLRSPGAGERRRGRNRSPAHEWWHRPRCRTARYR